MRLYCEIMESLKTLYRPLTSRKLVLFVYCLVKGNYKASTIESYVSTVRGQLVLKGDPPLCAQDNAIVKSAMRAAFKIADTEVKRAATVSLSVLNSLCCNDLAANFEVDTAMMLSFYALLRSAELLALETSDVTDNSTGNVKFLSLRIRRSKTDVYAKGATIAVGCVCESEGADVQRLCPYHRLKKWLVVRQLWKLGTGVRLFNMSKEVYGARVRSRLESVLPKELHNRCTSHSMRRSGAMSMINSGVSFERVSELGRWSGTETLVKNYLRDSSNVLKEQSQVALKCWLVNGE
jgi:hypothetical protein